MTAFLLRKQKTDKQKTHEILTAKNLKHLHITVTQIITQNIMEKCWLTF